MVLLFSGAQKLLFNAALIWCTVFIKWLLMAVTLDRFSFEVGIVLARTCRPTVSRHPELCSLLSPGIGIGLLLSSVVVMMFPSLVGGATGTMENPIGRRGMQEGSSPLMAS